MLTLQQLKDMEPNTIFASGIGIIEHPWFNDATPVSEGGNLDPDGRSTKIKWVAIRGGIHDWAIYHSLDTNFIPSGFLDNPGHLEISEQRITREGAKLHKEEDIKRFVPCDEEAFKMYRH